MYDGRQRMDSLGVGGPSSISDDTHHDPVNSIKADPGSRGQKRIARKGHQGRGIRSIQQGQKEHSARPEGAIGPVRSNMEHVQSAGERGGLVRWWS